MSDDRLSPYDGLPARAFWKGGVSGVKSPGADIYRRRFEIRPTDRIVTAGSCFAQHIAVRLKRNGYNVVDVEPPPPGMSASAAQAFGYNLYSARYGNIYTVRQLLQLTREAMSRSANAVCWEKDGRWFDAHRPSVEPQGLDSPAEVEGHRAWHLKQVRRAFLGADVFIFTLGLTEAWMDKETGLVFPTAPGVLAGRYDPDRYELFNQDFDSVRADFLAFRAAIRRRNPDVKFLLTVSPVPLTATASDEHVLAATLYSKSVLRAAAGELSKTFDDIDYFPSYELVASPFNRTSRYEANLRSVSADGVEAVMEIFFAAHGAVEVPAPELAPSAPGPGDDDVICEDALLEAFAP